MTHECETIATCTLLLCDQLFRWVIAKALCSIHAAKYGTKEYLCSSWLHAIVLAGRIEGICVAKFTDHCYIRTACVAGPSRFTAFLEDKKKFTHPPTLYR